MKTCLVIVDMQKGFINQHTKHLIEQISAYARTGHFDSIVGTRYVNHENTACYRFEGWKECMEGSDDANMLPKLEALCERVFVKDRYSCWNGEFKRFVRQHNFDKLIFVGVNTGCCVLHSVFDAYNDLQDCCVVENLCGSTSGPASHAAAIQVIGECITKERVITHPPAASHT